MLSVHNKRKIFYYPHTNLSRNKTGKYGKSGRGVEKEIMTDCKFHIIPISDKLSKNSETISRPSTSASGRGVYRHRMAAIPGVSSRTQFVSRDAGSFERKWPAENSAPRSRFAAPRRRRPKTRADKGRPQIPV
jgi:hypothetical protein